MPNGKPGDHPLTDIIVHRIPSISPEVDALIWDIHRFGGDKELDRIFRHNLRPDPLRLRANLEPLRDRLRQEAEDRGWEVE